MSSMQQEQPSNAGINEVFANKKLTGYDIACNNQLSQIVRRDSTDFATGLIKHERGREIVCELIDVALRPRMLISYLQKKRKQQQSFPQKSTQKESQFLAQGSVLKSQLHQTSKQVTTIVYNAIEILTNQYEQFVQFIFDQSSTRQELIKSGPFGNESIECNVVKKVEQQKNKIVNQQQQQKVKQTNLINSSSNERRFDDDDFADIDPTNSKRQMMINSGSLTLQKQQQPLQQSQQQQQHQQQNWQDCVIMDSGYPQLTRNQQDQLLKKIISNTKISHNDYYKCTILDRMFLLFYQPIPIQETPVSYFNKIMLQFVYQKPQQIMRYFYCDQRARNTKGNKANKGKKNNGSSALLLSSSGSSNKGSPRVRLIARHLYNNSTIQLLVHLMQLQSQGNFFSPQKTQILKSITQQVFSYPSSSTIKPDSTNTLKQSQPKQQQIMQTSTMWDLVQDRITNFIQFMRQLYQKLQDRYQQQKYLSIFRYYINDNTIIKKIIRYFKQQHNYFDINGLVIILTLILKYDNINFIKHKSQQQKSNPFSNVVDHFGFGNNSNSSQKQDSSILSYDLKLSIQVLDQIQDVLIILVNRYRQQQGSTMRMIQYYQLLYNWLNITISLPKYQLFNKTNLLTVGFINDCLFKFQEHQRSTILHNAIKNILVDFLPKLNDSIKVILAPQCQLVAFIQNYLHVDYQAGDKVGQNNINVKNKQQKKNKRKPKCFQNQLFHIGKAVLSIWQQQKMLSVIRKTQQMQDHFYQQHQQQQDYLQKPPYDNDIPQSPTSDSENLIRFERLREIITKKQQFYNHPICGDPRKMGQYQQQQSSQIIMVSSSSMLKNFFKPNLQFNNNIGGSIGTSQSNSNGQGLLSSNNTNKVSQKHQSKDRYADVKNDDNSQDDQQEQAKKNQKKQTIAKRKLEIEDLKRQTNLKTDPKFRSLRIGDDINHTQSLFQSAISPLNANRSHTFNFQMDALPLDSDNSDQLMSQQQDFPLRKASGEDDEIKLMQQNIENFDMVGGNNFVLGMQSNILSSNNSISHQRSISNNNTNHLLLSTDNYRRQQLSKSVEMPQLNIDTIQKVQSYLAIQSPRKQSQDQILSLGMDSKHSGSKMSEEQLESRLEVVTSEIVVVVEEEEDGGRQQKEQKREKQFINDNKSSQIQKQTTDSGRMDSNFIKHYSSYLSYNIDDLCMDLE